MKNKLAFTRIVEAILRKIARENTAQGINARIALDLAADPPLSHTEIARRHHVSRPRVISWSKWLAAEGPIALYGHSPGRPKAVKTREAIIREAVAALRDRYGRSLDRIGRDIGLSVPILEKIRVANALGRRRTLLRSRYALADGNWYASRGFRLVDVAGVLVHPAVRALAVCSPPGLDLSDSVRLRPADDSADATVPAMADLRDRLLAMPSPAGRTRTGEFWYAALTEFLRQVSIAVPQGLRTYVLLWTPLQRRETYGFDNNRVDAWGRRIVHMKLYAYSAAAEWTKALHRWAIVLYAWAGHPRSFIGCDDIVATLRATPRETFCHVVSGERLGWLWRHPCRLGGTGAYVVWNAAKGPGKFDYEHVFWNDPQASSSWAGVPVDIPPAKRGGLCPWCGQP